MNFEKFNEFLLAWLLIILTAGSTAIFLLGAYHFVRQVGWL